MDKQEYIRHTKARIIENFIKEMDAMSNDEILECGRTCPKCLGLIAEKFDQDSAILEGITPDEVDHMVGVVETHECKPTIFFTGATPSMVDYSENEDDEQLEDDQNTDDESESDYIMDALREALDMLSDAPNSHLILAYMYTKQDGSDSSGDIRGQSMIFGSRKFIDYLMDDIRSQIDKNTNDGYVSMGDALDDEPE